MFDWEFRDPLFLGVAVLAPLVYWWNVRSVASVQYSTLRLLDQTPASLRARFVGVPSLLLALSVVALAIALARPRSPDAQTRVDREGIAIMMIVDRSGSMNARDLVRGDNSIDRLTVVKQVFQRFLLGDEGKTSSGRPADMVGLVTFARYADSICPLTSDHGNLLKLVEQLKIADDPSEDGTAIGDGLGLAVERLRQSDVESKVAILLTDGVSNAGVIDPLKAARLAAANDVKVYCIGAGTTGVAPVAARDRLTGRTVLRGISVEIDEETLKNIAKETGGLYFRATDEDALTGVYRQIDQLERTKVEEIRYLNYTEHFTRFVLTGLGLASIACLLGATLFRRLP